MKHTIVILVTLLLVSSSVFANPPDLCEQDLYLDNDGDPLTDSQGVTLSRDCQWAGPDVPVWADSVCCSPGTDDQEGALCSAADGETKNRCASGTDEYYCKYGELTLEGFVCYQSFPSACELGACSAVLAPDGGPQEDVICCIGGICYPWDDKNYEDCGGVYTWCNSGYSKVDGTVECFD